MADPIAAVFIVLFAYLQCRVLSRLGGDAWVKRWCAGVVAAGDVVLAVLVLAEGRVVMAAGDAAAAAICGHWLWTNRRRRDRRPSKVAGVVKDLGHRLTVVPVPAGGDRG